MLRGEREHCIQLFPERLSEKVQVTIQKGFVGDRRVRVSLPIFTLVPDLSF